MALAAGFEVTSVAHNASVINFSGTAGSVRDTFHAQLHYWNVQGGKHIATATEPQIPAALAGVISGIAGLNQIPPHPHHTPIHSERYDAETHKWYPVDSAKTGDEAGATPHYLASNGDYNMTPQDFYTIYNVNPTFAAGNVGAGSTVAILGSGPFNYGAVSGGAAGGTATGGDVITFRNLFGIKTPLKLQIQSGSTNFPCSVDNGADSGESALDVEWSSALAPGATIIFESCSGATGGFLTEIQALVDANVADVISSSLGFSEPNITLGDTQAFEAAFSQAASQGQTVLSAQGDSGSDDVDFGSPQGTHGLSVDYPGSSPFVLSIGGTDFQDLYDVHLGSSTPQSTYWSATNSQYYGDALSYVPETAWNESCASPIAANDPVLGGAPGETTATFCNTPGNFGQHTGGGGGGVSIFFAQPSWQTGIPGLSAAITKRVTPDVSLFSASGSLWHHALVVCDSGAGPDQACTSPGTFGYAGGTSFAGPQFAGILGLLKTATGSRQGLVQPALYALAKAQYSAGTACYANGQAANTGVTTGLPASTCIFNDVTTSGNNNECQAGTTNCFTNAGASYGVMTASGNTSTFVDAYAAGAKYDLATGLGSVNVTNMIAKWNTAFSSATQLSANPTSITSSQSTVLTATVTTGLPPGFTGPAPTLAGSVTFSAAGVTVGSCTLSGNSCSATVSGSKRQAGSNSVIAVFVSSGAYPNSTSNTVTVTVTSSVATQTITFTALPNVTYGVSPIALTATASSGLPVSYTVTGNASISGSTLTITGVGTINVTASQAGNGSYSAATPVTRSFNVSPATLTVTAASFSRVYGAANPTLTYAITGFVNNDTSAVVSGSATLSTTATATSPVGSYPITFSTQSLTASNYTFTYVNGSLQVTVATQTITFGPLPNVTYGVSPIGLTGTASSGLPITYLVSGPATVSGSTLTVNGTGSITVTATQAGNGNYSAAGSVAQTFTSNPPAAGSVTLGTTSTLQRLADNSYRATVTIKNTGTGTAQAVQMKVATLGSANGTPAGGGSLPQSLGSIASGASVVVTYSFPASAGSPGAGSSSKFTGVYTGGTFGGTSRVTLP